MIFRKFYEMDWDVFFFIYKDRLNIESVRKVGIAVKHTLDSLDNYNLITKLAALYAVLQWNSSHFLNTSDDAEEMRRVLTAESEPHGNA